MKRCIRPTGTDAVITRREGLALAAGAAFSLAAGPVFAKTPIKDIEGFSGQAARHGLSIMSIRTHPKADASFFRLEAGPTTRIRKPSIP